MSSPAQPTPDDVRAALESVVTSAGFQNSDRMVRFLRYIVEKSLAGQAQDIKEYTLGLEVFDRDPSFDPKTETIVRVEARRLRRKLKEYYDSTGREDQVRIDIPTPGYAPAFLEGAAAPVHARRNVSPRILIAAGCVIAALGIAAFLWFRSPTLGDLSSIAVLPFANLSGDPNQDFFADGFTEEVIDRLASIENLRVAARTSVFEFKNKPRDVREIGRLLGVEAIVEGSVRRSGDTVRITAQLVRTSDGFHVWSSSWDRQLKDVLVVESEVADAVAERFRRRVTASRKIPVSPEAYDFYLLGRSLWNTSEPEGILKAIGYYEKAIAAAPDFALAYSGLSEAYAYMVDLDYAPTREIGPKARAAADRALALDESLAEAHVSRGLVALETDWDPERAEREFRRALQLKPNFAYGMHWMAHYLESRGKVADAEKEMRRALKIDPLSRMIQIDVSILTWEQRHFEDSVAALDRARALDPNYAFLDMGYGSVYLTRREYPHAIASFRKIVDKLGPIPMVIGALGVAEALSGDRKAALAEIATLENARKSGYAPAFPLALIHYALGDREAGYRWLKQAFDDRNGGLIWLSRTPLFDVMRTDPRAQALLEHVGNPAR